MKKFVAMICAVSMLMTAVCGITASAAADTEIYEWYSSGSTAAPIKAERYFIPSSSNLYEDTKKDANAVTAVEGGWTTTYLNDGSYAEGKNILFETRDSDVSASMPFEPEKDYVEVELGGKYVLSKVVIGASIAGPVSYNWNHSINDYNISWWNEDTQQWEKKEVRGQRIDGVDSNITDKSSKTITLDGVVTTKLRFELVSAVKINYNFTGITELIPYGFAAGFLKENYAWDTETDDASAPIMGTYSIGSAVTAKSGTVLDAGALYDGDYSTMQKVEYTNKSESKKTENHYFEVAFDKVYLIDKVDIGFSTAEQWYTVPDRSFVDYLDADTNQWFQILDNWDTLWPAHKDNEIAYKKIKSSDPLNVRAKAVRYYPGKISESSPDNSYHLSEFIVYGKTTYQGKSKEYYAWDTQTETTAAPISAKYSFGSNTKFSNYDQWVQSNIANLNDGSYDYVKTCLIDASGINDGSDIDRLTRVEDLYIQLDFDNTYVMDSLLIGVSALDNYHQKLQLGWYTVDYHDPVNDRWVQTNKYVDCGWKYNPDNEVHWKGAFSDSELADGIRGIRTDAVRIYPTETNNKSCFRIDELVVYGKTAKDVVIPSFAYTTADGNAETFTSDVTGVTVGVNIDNPTENRYNNARMMTAFYDGTTLVDVNIVPMTTSNAAAEKLTVPENATSIKVFIWSDENTPLISVIERTKVQ